MAAGITFQLPRGRDVGPHFELSCHARPCLLVAVDRLAGRWCFWRLRSWRWCFLGACGFGVSFSWTQRPVFFRMCPLDVLGLWLPATEASRIGGPLVVSVVTDQRLAIASHPGRQRWGSRSCTSSANYRCQARRLVQNLLTHLGVDGVRDGKLSTSRRVPFLGLVLGLRFALPETLRRHFLRTVAAAVISSRSPRRLRLRVAAQASRTSHSRCSCSSRR